MSFVSYLEDIEKIRDALRHLASRVPEFTETDVLARRNALTAQVELIASKLDKLLEIATDPQISLADDFVALRTERENVGAKSKDLELELDRAKQLSETLSLRLKESEKKEKLSNSAFDRLASSNFAAALELYPPKEGKKL